MATSCPLLLDVVRMGVFSLPMAEVQHAAYVLDLVGGGRLTLPRPPVYGRRAAATTCHVVDVSQHTTRATLAVPAHGDVYTFAVGIDVLWYVTHPEAVIDSTPPDPDRLVAERIRDRLWNVVRNHEPTSTAAAEASARAALELPTTLEEGLSVVRVAVRVQVDPRLGAGTQPPALRAVLSTTPGAGPSTAPGGGPDAGRPWQAPLQRLNATNGHRTAAPITPGDHADA